MQNNTITVGEVTYDRFQEYPDRSVYISPTHTIGRNDLFSLSRVVPTSEGATARVRVKFVLDIVNPETLEKAAIYATTEVSMPTWAGETVVEGQALQLALFMQTPEFGQLLSKQSI